MRTIILKMTEKEFEAFFDLAEENAITLGASGDGEDDSFGDVNKKKVKTVNKMLKYNRVNKQINY
jgi:hypothetical protein